MITVMGVTHSCSEAIKRFFMLITTELFLAVPWVCLRFVIVVFPDHTHLLFLIFFPINVSIRNSPLDNLKARKVFIFQHCCFL